MTFVSLQSNIHVPLEEMVIKFFSIHHIIGLHLCVIEMNMQVESWVILVWTGVYAEVLILWLYQSINVGDLFSLILVKKVHVRLKAWEVASNFDFFFFTQGLHIFLMYSEGSWLYLFKINLKTKKGTYEISSLLHPWEYIHTPNVEPRVLCKWERAREKGSYWEFIPKMTLIQTNQTLLALEKLLFYAILKVMQVWYVSKCLGKWSLS